MSASKLHAEFSASGSKRWLSCPGSILLSRGLPDQEESKYAMEGTTAHTVLDLLVRGWLKGRRLSTEAELRSKYPLQMVTHASWALDWMIKECDKEECRYKHLQINA